MSDMTLYMIGGAVVLLLLIYAFIGDDENDKLQRRLERVLPETEVKLNKAKQKKADELKAVRRINVDNSLPGLSQILNKLLPNPDKIRQRLERTGRNFSIAHYALMSLMALMLCILMAKSFALPGALPWLLGLVGGAYLPHMFIGYLGNRRVNEFVKYFPDAIDTLCRGLRSGLPITESINAVGREMRGPTGLEFRRISDSVRMGRSLEDSMWEVARRIDTPEFRFLIIAMAIQRETGGNLAETLGNLGEVLRRRRQLRLKIRAMSAEAKASASIIGSLPFVMFTILFMVNRPYVMTLITDERGMVMTGIGLFWISLGVAVMAKMIKFEI